MAPPHLFGVVFNQSTPALTISCITGGVVLQGSHLTKFDELKSQGKILIVVGHELKETTRNYDRFLLINKTVIADGSQQEVITANNIQKAYGDNVIFFERNN